MASRLNIVLLFGLSILLVLPTDRSALGEIGGSAAPIKGYTSHYRRSEINDEPEFDAQLDYVAFPLSTWQGKYRLVRVRVANTTKTPVSFSSEQDVVQAELRGGEKVSAHLIPSASAPELWDKLDANTRTKLAYPKVVAPDKTMYVYLFFPADKLTAAPAGFTWHIASLKKTISIFPPPATATK